MRASTRRGAIGTGAQDLERDPAHVALLAAVEPLDLAADQPGRGPGVLEVGVPGSTGELGGHVEVALGPEEGVGHGADRMGRRAGVTTADRARLT